MRIEMCVDDYNECERCGGEGFILTCCDDMCHGLGYCIHGDGENVCPSCNGSGVYSPFPDLGSCCACGLWNKTVRNIVSLEYEGPTPGKGWGCFQCDRLQNGAIAVLCDECLKELKEIKFICTGYPGEDGRTCLEGYHKKPFGHDLTKHPEININSN